jgi:hypothetical protein
MPSQGGTQSGDDLDVSAPYSLNTGLVCWWSSELTVVYHLRDSAVPITSTQLCFAPLSVPLLRGSRCFRTHLAAILGNSHEIRLFLLGDVNLSVITV